jgi:hypothetical protein
MGGSGPGQHQPPATRRKGPGKGVFAGRKLEPLEKQHEHMHLMILPMD